MSDEHRSGGRGLQALGKWALGARRWSCANHQQLVTLRGRLGSVA